MKKNENTAIVSGALVLTCVNLFSQVLGFAFRVWLSRLISPQALGLYQLIMPVYNVMMSLCVSGFTVAVSRLVAGYTALGNERNVRQVVRKGLMFYIFMTIAFSMALYPFSDLVSANLLGDARTRLGLVLLLPCMLLTGWENVHKNFFYGKKNVIPPAVAELVEQTTRTAAILGLLYFIKPLYEETQVGYIVVGMIISEVFSASLLTFFYKRDRSKAPDSGIEERHMFSKITEIAVPVAFANVCVNFITSANSIIIPGRLIKSGVEPSEALGAYGIAFGMTMPLLALPMALVTAISLVMIPRISESAALKDNKALTSKIKTAMFLVTVITFPITSLLMLYGKQMAVALFKNPDAGSYMIPLSIATLFVCYEYVTHSLLNGAGLQKRAAVNMVTAGLVQLVITYVAVARPELRLWGFVWAFIIGNVLGTSLNIKDLYAAGKGKAKTL